MKRYIQISLLLVCGCSSLGTVANAVPVVPNFTQGSMQTQTSTQQQVVEIINSVDYRTGWEYTVTGVGIENNDAPLNPTPTASSTSITATVGTGPDDQLGYLESSFDSLDLTTAGEFTIADPGQGFQFTQSYSGPGLTNQTIIKRTSVIDSVTNTTSIFSN